MKVFFLSLLAGPPVAALGALIVGFFCVRLTGIYFAMLSLAFGELLFYIVFSWYSFTKGDDGIQGLLPPLYFQDAVHYYYLTLAIVVAALLAMWRSVASPGLLGWQESGIAVFMTLIGGAGAFIGPIVGSVIYTMLQAVVKMYTVYWPLTIGTIH